MQTIRREVTMEIEEKDLSWLAGIMDGEGNIMVSAKKASANDKRYLAPKVRVSNTDMRMTRKLSEIYFAMGLKYHFAIANLKNPYLKTAISINITAQGSCRKLLKSIIPYLVNKKRMAEIVVDILDFIKPFPKGGNTVRRNYWDTPTMRRLMEEYSKEKAWSFDPSTTTRRANSIFEFGDIV